MPSTKIPAITIEFYPHNLARDKILETIDKKET